MKKATLLLLLTVLLTPFTSHADDSLVDDAFDPFADYSDFVEASTEETDINFFKFGRMLSIGGILGMRSFTGNLATNQSSDTYFGGTFTYYMSLQFAVQLSYHTGGHTLVYDFEEEGATFSGQTTYTTTSMHGKYFINTQNLTKTIARYNPFIVGGFSQINRDTNTIAQPNIASRDTVGSFDIGAGVEYLFNNNKNFVSLQAIYYKADFPNEGREVILKHEESGEDIPTGIKPNGDLFSIQVSIGFNF
ncbi:MAG: hypothetical protein ACRBBP_01415 [Bdellovibrionales bacterium]